MNDDQTDGEQHVQKVLEQLPSDEFICYVEPRIDSEGKSRYPDFVIVWPSRGVLAIEVKDWVKLIEDDSNQKNIQIQKRTGEITSKENPARTAKQYAENLVSLFEKRRELFSRYEGLEKLSFPCEGIAILPNIDGNTILEFENSGVFPENKVFSGEILRNVTVFRKILEKIPWTWPLHNSISDELIQIINHTIKLTAINIRNETNENINGAKIGSLNHRQEELIFSPLPMRDAGYTADLIRGSVGSGKTVVLTKRAELLASARPDLKVLVTAFNLDLTKDLRNRIQNKNIQVLAFFDICKKVLGDNWPKVEGYRDEQGPATIKRWVRNNQELIGQQGLGVEYVAMEIARRKDSQIISDDEYFKDVRSRNEPIDKSQQETICAMYDLYREYREILRQNGQSNYDFEDVPDLTLRALFGHKMERFFDVIMIDEAQDWAPKWIQLIKRLLKPGGYLFICDDPAQSLWRFFDWKQKGLTNYSKHYLELPERNTKQIMEFAQCLFDINNNFLSEYDMDVVYPVKTDHLKSGSKPLVMRFLDIEKELSGISDKINTLLSIGVHGEQIGILCPENEEAKLWRTLEIVKLNQIYVGHFNVMKGLEFGTVFIPHLNKAFGRNEVNPSITTSISMMRRLFVAMTRARENLIISSSYYFPEVLEPLLIYADVV